MRSQDKAVIGLLFAAPALGVLAASEILPPTIKLVCAALAAGCASVLAVLRPVGTSIVSRSDTDNKGGDAEAARLERVRKVNEAKVTQ